LLAQWRRSTVLAAAVALFTVVALLGASLLLGGFGVPVDATPNAINPNSIPFNLSAKTSPPNPPTTTHPKPTTSESSVILYFIGPNGYLVPVASVIGRPVSLLAQINLLLSGTGNPAIGAPASVQSAIPYGTQVLSAKVSDGVATVDLSSDIEVASGEQLIQAFAQLVYTATTTTTCPSQKTIKIRELPPTTTTTDQPGGLASLPCADRVVFQVDGQSQQIPTTTGAQTSKPVTRADYLSIYS